MSSVKESPRRPKPRSKLDAPAAASDPSVRGAARELLVELPNRSPGIGIKLKAESGNVVLVYPRAGQPIVGRAGLLALQWHSLTQGSDGTIQTSAIMNPQEVERFLDQLYIPE